jgi:hypothetical protein
MRQVSKEEFEILTRFHPGEVRYYVDISNATKRTKGAKISVKRKPKASKKAKKRVSPKAGINAKSGRVNNAPLQLGLRSPSFKANTKSESQWRLVKLQLHNDPTMVVGRTDLVNTIVAGSVYTNTQIGPFVSDCLKQGYLRYKRDLAAAA